jgi:hypothetical protein
MTWFRKDTRIRWIEMNEERSAQDAAREIASMFPGATSVDSDRE